MSAELKEFLQKLAECVGHCSVEYGIVTFEDGTSFNLAAALNTEANLTES